MCREQGEGGWWWWWRRRRRRPGTRHACGGRARETREARKRGRRRRGVVRKARPPDPHRPHTRGEDARSRTQPSVHEGRSTPPAATPCRNEGRGGAGRGGARRGPPSSLRTPPPVASPPAPAAPGAGPGTPGPGQHRGRPTRPQAPVRPPAPEGRGMPGGEDTATGPRAADRGGGTRPALGRAHPERGARRGALVGGVGGHGRSPSPSPRRCRRTGGGGGGGGKAGNGSGPRQARGSETHQGAAPGSSRRGADRGGRAGGRTDGRRGAPTGCSHVTPMPRNRRWRRGWPRATARGGVARNDPGEASRPLGRTAGSHRQRPPSTGAVPRHTQDDRLASPATHTHTPTPAGAGGGAHPSRGLTPTATYNLEPQPARENALPPRTGGPHSPRTRNPTVHTKAPPPRPPLRAPRALLHPGTPPADRGRETTPT